MPRFLLDTSCMVAAVCAWHVDHRRAASEFERRLADGETMVVAGPALIEAYSVLTRLPPPHRLSPADSLALLEANFMNGAVEIVALDALAYQRLLSSAPERAIAGGRVYDAVIVACGVAGRADTILTFNDRQFRPLAGQEVEIVVPA